MQNFIFGNSTPWTYEQLQRKREIADRLAAQVGKPKNVGEGLSALGSGIAAGILSRRADKRDAALRDEFSSSWESALGGMGGMFGGGYGGGSYGSKSYTAPTPEMTGLAGGTRTATDATVNGFADGGAEMGGLNGDPMVNGIIETAAALGIDPIEVATLMSYETGGTLDPMQPGPTTQWGQHRGLIQFGEPQAAEYGVDFSSPEAAMASQLGADGAIVKYARAHGFEPGMSGLDLYSTINAGAPGRYGASDANNGGAPGTVRDKYEQQMGGHRAKAEALLAGGGNGGMRGFAQPGGTTTSMAMNAPGGAPARAGGGMPTGNMATVMKLAELGASPYASAGQKAVVNALIGQQMAQMQPQAPVKPDWRMIDGIGMVDMNNPPPELMAGQYQEPLDNGVVQARSSEILPDGTIIQSTDTGPRVFAATGEELTGTAAADKIREARDYGVEIANQTNYGRRSGTLEADIDKGGEAASAVAAGENAQKAGMAAWEALGTVQQSIPKLQRVIELVDAGAATGTIANQFPALNDATKELRLIQSELGLDVVGAVTFGALSEGELRLALSTALPTNLSGEGLKDWVNRKIEAQTKLAAYYNDQARFLMAPGNTLTGWMDYMESQGESPVAGGQPAPQAGQQAPMTPDQIKGVISGLNEGERESFMAMPRDQQLEFVRKRLGAAQ